METLKTEIDGANLVKAKHERVIVKRDQPPKELRNIYTTEESQKTTFRKNTGVVLSHGARCTNQVHAGQHVMFGRAAGTEITINDSTVIIMNEKDLMLDLDTLTPFHDKVLVRPDEMPKQIKSIIIPDNIQEQPQSGTVERTGPGCVETSVSERILMGKFAGAEIEVKGDKFLILREADIFASI